MRQALWQSHDLRRSWIRQEHAGLGHTDYQALSFTNSAVQGLVGNGIGNAATFDAYFELGGGNGTVAKVQQLSHRKLILVDEYSNASPVHLGLVARALDLAKIQGRTPPDVILCGDSNQCLPVAPGCKDYDYQKCDVIRRLCYSNRLMLCYKPGSARYDSPLNQVLTEFLDTGTVSEALCNDKTLQPDARLSLTFLVAAAAATANTVNAARWTGWVPGAPGVGTPVIAQSCSKDIKVYTGQMFSLTGMTAEVATLTHVTTGATTEVPMKLLNDRAKFAPCYACSAIKAQGSTITHPYNILDIRLMTKRMMYTALSRGQRLSDVCFDWTSVAGRVFVDKPILTGPTVLRLGDAHAPTRGCGDANKYADTKVYHILHGLDVKYVGQTVQSLEDRWAGHCGAVHCSATVDKAMMKIQAYIK
jgi:hypothetical protein